MNAISFCIILCTLIITAGVSFCYDRWLDHKEIMADKRILFGTQQAEDID